MRLPKIILNAGEVEAILNVPDLATAEGVKFRAILETLYSTGVRRQELCNLCLGDVDHDRGLLRIDQGKGSKDRYVPTAASRVPGLPRQRFQCFFQ